MHFFKLLSLPSAQQVVKADAAETWFVLFDIRLAEKLAVILLLMFKSTPLYCDSANSQSNPGLKPGFLLVLSCRGWISPREANEQKLIYFCRWWGGNSPLSPHLFLQNVGSLLHRSLQVANENGSEQQRSWGIEIVVSDGTPWLCSMLHK